MAADGSIIIDTRVNTKGIDDGTKHIEAKLNGLMATAKNLVLCLCPFLLSNRS